MEMLPLGRRRRRLGVVCLRKRGPAGSSPGCRRHLFPMGHDGPMVTERGPEARSSEHECFDYQRGRVPEIRTQVHDSIADIHASDEGRVE